jgi:hypothetical protein
VGVKREKEEKKVKWREREERERMGKKTGGKKK